MAAGPTDDTGPEPARVYTVRSGDCISSIAKDNGLFWETIWDDPANAELRETRGDPNILFPGDRVTIPPSNEREETVASDSNHRFVRRGEPAFFHIRLLLEGEPRADEPYTVEVDGETIGEGITSAQGDVRFQMPADADSGTLRVGEGEDEDTYSLRFGGLDPISEVTGVQQRLHNLSYLGGPADGEAGERTRGAIESFQRDNGIEPTGEADETTKNALRQAYGS